MSLVHFQKVKDEFGEALGFMLARTRSASAGWKRVYQTYQDLQLKRFTTEGQSEGANWPPLTEKYRIYKEKRFQVYPGAGKKMLIATSTFAGAIIGKANHDFGGIDHHQASFDSEQMLITVDQSGKNAEGKEFRYASFVDDRYSVMEFSEDSIDQMKEELEKFIFEG